MRANILRLLRYGAVSFVIGLGFLMACLVCGVGLLHEPLAIDRSIVAEGLLILGWVAIWRPTDALLYDWWSLAWRRTLLRRLASIPAEIRARP